MTVTGFGNSAWQAHYRSHLRTPEEAIASLPPAVRLYVPGGPAEPTALMGALLAAKDRFQRVEVVTTAIDHTGPPWYNPWPGRPFIVAPILSNPHIAAVLAQGAGEYVPVHLSGVAALASRHPTDAAFLHVSPPDERGMCSTGIWVESALLFAKTAGRVIAQVNAHMPYTFGDSEIPVSMIDTFVAADTPLPEVNQPAPGERELAIGRYVADLVADGAVLQAGVGAIPMGVVRSLRHKRCLGIHSGVIGPAIAELIDAGVATGAAKEIDSGLAVATMVLGSRSLYTWCHRNPALRMKGCDYTHHPAVLSRLSRFTAVNSALSIDLGGQVNADELAGAQVAGTGGLADFARAAALSPGGQSIIVMAAAAGRGPDLSRIVTKLDGPATLPRADAGWVVTEFGAADLRERNLHERAELLAGIAHPAFRDGLCRHTSNRSGGIT